MDNKHITILHCNIGSIFKNHVNIESNTELLNYDIIILSEAWIKPGTAHIPSLPGYCYLFQCSNCNQAGGVVIYIRSHIQHIRLSLPYTCDNLEYVALYLPEFSLNVVGFYRHPISTNFDSFILTLDDIISCRELNRHNCKTIYGGDLNINLLQKTATSKKYLDCLHHHCLIQLINTPTRVVNGVKSLIDHFFINENYVNQCNVGVKSVAISDHYPIYIKFNTMFSKYAELNNCNTYINKAFINTFKMKIASKNWSFLDSLPLEEKFNQFCKHLSSTYKEMSSLKVTSFRPKKT